MPNVPYQNQLVGWIQMKKSIVINVSALYELKIIPLPDDENSQFNSFFENIPGCLMTQYHSIISCYVIGCFLKRFSINMKKKCKKK